MHIPFTTEQFFALFRAYNEAVWPAQLALLALATAAAALALASPRGSGVAVTGVLAFLWAWMAAAYHLAFFARINPLAPAFAALSLAGAAAFLREGVVRRRLRFARPSGARAVTGAALLVFALIAYPAWSWRAGHPYPDLPTFGLPCPTTIFTIGMLAFAQRPAPRSVFIAPAAWSAIGSVAAFSLEVRQDLGLLVAGLACVALAVSANSAEDLAQDGLDGRASDGREPS